jgi:O-antigen ligase/tetratricopeptide (TPR) repeat protein
MSRQTIVNILKGIMYAGIYGGLLMPLVFIPVVIFPFVFSKLIFFQILIGLTFPAYPLLAWMEPTYRPKKHMLYLAVGAYFVAMGLSVVFGVDPMRSWWGNQERMNGLFTLLHFFAWLTMTVSLITRWEQWRKLLNYQIGLAVFMALVAMLQRVYPNLLLFPANERVGGLLDNPIYMASYQIFTFFFLALLAIKDHRSAMRLWYGIAGFFALVAFLLAQSRGALIGLAAGFIVFGLYYAFFAPNKKIRKIVLGLLALGIIGYGLAFAFRDTAFISNSPLARLTQFNTSVSTRFIAWNIAWQGFKERPLTGWGLDNFHIIFNSHYNPKSLRFGTYETWFDRSHNTVLDVLSMTGVLGFITFVGIFASLFYTSWRAFKKGWIDLPVSAVFVALPIAYLVQNLFVFDHPAAFSMSYLLFALVIAATRGEFVGKKDVEEEVYHGERRDFPFVAGTIVYILALIVVWNTSIQPFNASKIAIMGSQAFAARQEDIAYDLYSRSMGIWTPYRDELSFLLSRDLVGLSTQGRLQTYKRWKEFYGLAVEASKEELARHPKNTNPQFLYARLVHEMAPLLNISPAEVEERYRIAIATSPKRQQIYFGLARLFFQTNRPQDAINVYRQVRDFDPGNGDGSWTLGVSLFYDVNQKEEGAREIIQSQKVEHPYSLKDPREISVLVDAYITQKDDMGLQTVVEKLDTFPPGDASVYAALAHQMQAAGKADLQEKVLAYGESVDPRTRTLFRNPAAATTPTPAPATPPSNQVATNTAPSMIKR